MKRFLIIVAVLAMLVPGALLAQDGLTLEGLAKKNDRTCGTRRCDRGAGGGS